MNNNIVEQKPLNIIVLVKQVPDTTEIKIDKNTGTLIRAGVPTIINPDDLAGIEEALQLKEKHHAHVRVISMGPTQAEEMLRECYARGVDDCVLLCDGRFAGSDTWATSNALVAAIRLFPYDLIIAGRQAIDGDTAQVGPQIAEKLCLPQITLVEDIVAVNATSIRVKKAWEDCSQELVAKFPCLITTLSTMNHPRSMNCRDIWTAFDKEIKRLTFDDLALGSDKVGLIASPTTVKKTFAKEVGKTAPTIQVDAKEAAVMIARALKEKHVAL